MEIKKNVNASRKALNKVRPCIKGSLIAAVSIFLTHKDIGIGQITTNIIFGGFAYFFLAFAGIIIIQLLRTMEDSSYDGRFNDLKKGKRNFGLSYGLSIGITVFNVILFNLNIVSIIIAIAIGIIWLILAANVKKGSLNLENVNKIIVSLAFSLGIIYGAFLNTYLIPFFVLFFFLSVSFLQVSREMIKGFINKKEKKESILNRIKSRNKKETTSETVKKKKVRTKAARTAITTQQDKNILKKTLLLYIAAVGFVILTIFSDIAYPVYFMFLSIFGSTFIVIATFLTLKTISNEQFYNKLGILTKFEFLLIILAFFMAS